MNGLPMLSIIKPETKAPNKKSSIQAAINSGSAWSFQGSYGRTMMSAIEGGYCMLGKRPARDYYGNRIPSRDEVKSGTKGSREYVVDAVGEDWANYMEAV